METGATLSHCGVYRYLLWRIWNEQKKRLVFIMLNPSTAAHTNNDKTINRCMRFAATNGYGGIIVANLFAYRCTNSDELPCNEIAIGPDNDTCLAALVDNTKQNCDVVFAWGTKGAYLNRNRRVIAMFPNALCLEKTKDGHPKHPLYIKGNAKLTRFAPQQ